MTDPKQDATAAAQDAAATVAKQEATAAAVSSAQQLADAVVANRTDNKPPEPPAPPPVEQPKKSERVVRFFHHTPGATYIEGHNKLSDLPQAMPEGSHEVHRFVGGFLDVDVNERPQLFKDLYDASQQRGSGITIENEPFKDDPSIQQAAMENRLAAQTAVEKILGKKL